MTRAFLFLAPLAAACASPALAELPQPVRAMIETAAANGDAGAFAAVVAVARQTNPDDGAEIDALVSAFEAARAEEEAARAEARTREIRQAGFFERWSGKGEIGAFLASGNSDNTGVTAALALTREGIAWTHKLRGRVDYQRSNGTTSREQFFAAYEPRYQLSDDLFAYGLGQWERDRIQGYSARYAVSGGLGYTVIDTQNAQLSVKGGPAFRRTEFVSGATESSLAALVGLDFDWQFAEGLKLTQDANAIAEAGGEAVALIGGPSTSVTLVTGLDAQVSDRLSTRLSFTLDYDSDPPAGAVKTDTLTRFTLIYGF